MPAKTSRSHRLPYYCLTALLGATIACAAPPPASLLQPQATAQCAQPPLEEALAYDPGSQWFNVQDQCGCLPTSCPSSPSDLTACIQTQLDTLKTAGSTGLSPILYFPNGTYVIAQTLALTGNTGVTLMGEDPAKTVIVWGGAPAQADPPTPNAPTPACTLPLSDSQPPACDVGNMLHIDGSSYIKITRLTLDGQIPGSTATAKAALRVAYYKEPGHFASTGNEFSDLVLRHAWYGIRAAIPGGSNDAENTVRRVSFEQLSVAGFSAESDNSLNNNIWDSRFTNCHIGVRAIPGSVNVYNNTFLRSGDADIVNGGHQGFNLVIQGNTSLGSPTFYRDDISPSMANLLIQDNRIAVTTSTAIYVAVPQNALILDNVIQTAPPPSGSSSLPIVVRQLSDIEYPQPSNHVITGNVFSAPEASAVCAFKGTANLDNIQMCWGHDPNHPSVLYLQDPLYANLDGGYFYGNTFGTTVSVRAPAPAPTPVAKSLIVSHTPSVSSRVAPCNGAAGCSDVDNINNALRFLSHYCDQRPILHLRAGHYHIQNTITLPTGCPIQVFGDGASAIGTILSWDVPAGAPNSEGYMFELPSPAQAVIQDLRLANKAYFTDEKDPKDAAGRGILVHAPNDPAGGVVYLNQVNLGAANRDQRPLPAPPKPEDNVGFVSSGLDYLNIQAEQSSFGGDVAIRIIGSGAGAQGMDTVRAAKFYGLPLSAIYKSQFEVQNYGNLYVSGFDAEGLTHGIRLDGPTASGRLTLTTGRIMGSVNNAWTTLPLEAGKIVVGAFTGDVYLLGFNLNMPVRVTADANATAHVLGFGLYYGNAWVWSPRANGGWVTEPQTGSWNSDGPPSPCGSPCKPSDPPKAYPELKPQPLAPAPTYVDCAHYAAWNVLVNGTPSLSYAGVLPTTQPYYPSAQGVFYVEGATSAGHSWFLNNRMWNYDSSDPYGQGYFHTATRCGDVKPPQAAAPVVPVIDAALQEVRKAQTAVPHPCGVTTDVRVFRMNSAAVAQRTGFAILGFP